MSEDHHTTLEDPADVDLTMVVPYYNSGPRLRPTIDDLIVTLGATGLSFEIIAVSDGSTDGSETTLEGFDPSMVQTIRCEVNRGKGAALRVGMSRGRGRFVGFIDADGDLPPQQILSITPLLGVVAPMVVDERRQGPRSIDVILGSKRHPESKVVQPKLRRLCSGVWQRLVATLFRLSARDTQTGLKLVRREVLASVLPLMHENGFAFDLELLVVARHRRFRRCVEVPVTILERSTTTVSVKTVAIMFVAALRIFIRLHLMRSYG